MQQDLVICEQCDAVHRWRPLQPREVAQCSRCGAVLARGHRLGAHALLALTVAALLVLLIANLTPVVDMRLRGVHNSATLPGAIHDTWLQGERLVASAAAFTAIVAPGLLITLRLLVLVPLARGRAPGHLAWCMRVLHEMSRWSMVEVMMVAAAVCIVRIASMAQAVPGPGMFAFGALALLLAALESGGLKHLWMQAP
ncbi:paraquat-inducible protein A [Piscinibacter sp. XHJ-5]|uniref:paraquat-inducible protein A n=1 Tax=Piscinibacter sp. XHJ-5 TaxID=3037797 RepID=UPI002452E06A|nr:paraquat-inducible protein A [Piscinibacter sp. XHJ-5]